MTAVCLRYDYLSYSEDSSSFNYIAGFGTKMHHFMIEFRYVIDLFNIEILEIVKLHEKMHTVNLTVGYMY